MAYSLLNGLELVYKHTQGWDLYLIISFCIYYLEEMGV